MKHVLMVGNSIYLKAHRRATLTATSSLYIQIDINGNAFIENIFTADELYAAFPGSIREYDSLTDALKESN